jgi:hypothetical protein
VIKCPNITLLHKHKTGKRIGLSIELIFNALKTENSLPQARKAYDLFLKEGLTHRVCISASVDVHSHFY